MAKKTWIKLKRGLLEPKHRDALGIRIWLYLYILDVTDWETGQVLEWRDADAADDLQMPQRTIRDQRVKLENDGYIQCYQGHHKQVIRVMNWTDPRLHAETAINHGDNNLTPLDNPAHGDIHGDNNGDIHGDNNGDIHGDNNGYMNIDTPTSIKQITDNIPHNPADIFKTITGVTPDIMRLQMIETRLQDIRDKYKYTDERLIEYLTPYYEWWIGQRTKTTNRQYDPLNLAWMDKAAAGWRLPEAVITGGGFRI